MLKAQGIMILGCCPFIKSKAGSIFTTANVVDEHPNMDNSIDMTSCYSYHGSGMQHLTTFSRIKTIENSWSSPESTYDDAPEWAQALLRKQAALTAEVHELKVKVEAGNAGKHEIRRVDNQGTCGVCPVFDRSTSGQRMACITCQVWL
jgi:hypothetical protein